MPMHEKKKKTLQYCKVISLQQIKINEEKKKKENETRQSKIRQNKKQTRSVGVSNPTPERVPKEQMIALLIFGVSFDKSHMQDEVDS